ncbi:alpha-hydroxy-acid oxidizing protein [Litoreibacter arenae]|uniref:L-lactate dehydrogenase n=1 Tax=Litoreibacter arenae DSM 19593 TaxID=1123360 RepID=S9QEH6_9RHOB|nr:L-lactate dehydrogenase [Litoreibacter arenae DSM 19593]
MMGRPWHYALGALGDAGPAHLADMLAKDMASNMGQLGTRSLGDIKNRII